MHLTLCKFVKLHCIQGYSRPMLLQDGSFVVLCHVLHCSFFFVSEKNWNTHVFGSAAENLQPQYKGYGCK